MQLLPSNEKEIIDGLLPLLQEVWEENERVVKMKGFELIKAGTHEIKNKAGLYEIVAPDGDYVASQPVKIKVNHKERMKIIIKHAKNIDQMQDRLAQYLVENAKPREEATKIIKPDSDHK